MLAASAVVAESVVVVVAEVRNQGTVAEVVSDTAAADSLVVVVHSREVEERHYRLDKAIVRSLVAAVDSTAAGIGIVAAADKAADSSRSSVAGILQELN